MRLERAAAPVLATFLLAASPAWAQQLKPLDVEQDRNGVDLLSGKVLAEFPTLSVPAAPHLRLQKLEDLTPILGGTISTNTYAPGSATYEINGGGDTSDYFTCTEDTECRTKKRNGSALLPQGTAVFEYYQGGTGKLIVFDQQNAYQGPPTASTGLSLYASRVQYPDGEALFFTYDVATASNGQVWRRPRKVDSSRGYTLSLIYHGQTYGQPGWSDLAQATITKSDAPTVPLARLSYTDTTITDLIGRQWDCNQCTNSLAGMSATTLRLPGEASETFKTENQLRTYGSVTHSNWVTKVTNDGVDWNYSYVPGSEPRTTISKVTITAPLGFSRTVNIYRSSSARPRVTSTVDSFGRETKYAYDNDVRVSRVTYPEGNADAVVYDALGNITESRKVAKPGGGADIVEQAFYGGIEPATGALCHWASCFKPIWTRDAKGNQTDYTWDTTHGGLLTKLEPTDADGQRRKTISEWEGSRLKRERVCAASAAGVELTCGTPDEQVREFTYWQSTLLPETVTRTDGVRSKLLTTRFSYDAAGRLTSSDGPLPGSDDAAYYRHDAAGRRTWVIGPKGANGVRTATRTTYRDSDDKPVATDVGTVPDENSSNLTTISRTDVAYDTYRNLAREAVSAGGTTYSLVQRSSDARGRPECEARRMNPAVAVSLSTWACELGAEGSFGPDRITRNVLDAESRLLKEQRAYATPMQQDYATYGYSLNGKRTSVTDANGNRAELRYDGFDRQNRWVFSSKTVTGSVNEADYEAYGYDVNGNRTSVRKRDGTVLAFNFDTRNRLTRKDVPASASGAASYSVYYGYDPDGRQTSARFGSATGPGITNTYDAFGRLTSSTNSTDGASRTLSYLYDEGGRRSRLTFPDGNHFAYDYDAAGKLTGIRENSSQLVASFTYDAAGRLAGRTSSGLTSSYGYDGLSRLSSLNHDPGGTVADQSLGFSYSPASQIATLSRANDRYAFSEVGAASTQTTANGLNQIVSKAGTLFAYDGNGNLASDGATAFVYDGENRLVSASGAKTAIVGYDPTGRLNELSANGSSTRFLYDGDELIGEYDASGSLLRRYVHGTGTDDPVLVYEGSGLGARRSLVADQQGSIIAVTDAAGNIVAVNRYDEYGTPQSSNSGRFGYTAQLWLPELGVFYYKARMYKPVDGVFMQTDPIGYNDQINLYAYVANDPINRRDPTGLAKVCTQVTGSNIPACVGVDGNGDGKTSDNDLNAAQRSSLSSQFRGAIIANRGRDISGFGKPVQGSASEADKAMTRVTSQFVGATVGSSIGWSNYSSIRADADKGIFGYASSSVCGGDIAPACQNTAQGLIWITGQRMTLFSGSSYNPSQLARMLIHESMHSIYGPLLDKWSHVQMDEAAKGYLRSGGLAGGGCSRGGGFYSCDGP